MQRKSWVWAPKDNLFGFSNIKDHFVVFSPLLEFSNSSSKPTSESLGSTVVSSAYRVFKQFVNR